MIKRFLDKISSSREKPSFLTLGDSIISDCYPGAGKGVASLVQQRLQLPQVGVCRTGYQLPDLEVQLSQLPSKGVKVALVSIGGNDLLCLDHLPKLDDPWFADFQARYTKFWRELQSRYPEARWLACNLYDPTNGSGQVPGRQRLGLPPRPELIEALLHLNHIIAQAVGPALVDLYSLCLGHGWNGDKPLWFQMDIEPNQEGARQMADWICTRLGL